MNLTRKQELALIDIGLKTLINETLTPKVRRVKKVDKHSGRKWSPSQKRKFLKTMRAKWAEKRRSAA